MLNNQAYALPLSFIAYVTKRVLEASADLSFWIQNVQNSFYKGFEILVTLDLKNDLY